MKKITLLPENVINKIAAGEVVERPASVVKELLENSLDAGANSISVAIKHGGRELIRVTDNGEGMDREDAGNSLKRHATSKIDNMEDIYCVRSFGFRGEALPSIAAVSRLSLLSRRSDIQTGTEIKVVGGRTESIRQTGMAPGTTVEVAHLFFNTPARKKFLRTERAELIAILDILTTFSLGNSTVDFKFLKDDKLYGKYPGCISLEERIAQVNSKEIADGLIPLDAQAAEIKISGFIAEPGVSRVNRTGQYFFINNRPVKNLSLSFALQQGYGEMLPHRRYPFAVLFFEIESSRVDVNVHPNKKEVRVAKERDIQKILLDTVKATLHAQKRIPSVRLTTIQKDSSDLIMKPERRHDNFSYFESNGLLSPNKVNEGKHESPYSETNEDSDALGEADNFKKLKRDSQIQISNTKIIGQYQATYIIAEIDGNLFIIDQHAAHERIMYEKLLDRLISADSPSQRHLMPIIFSLDYREQEMLEEYLPTLEQIGFGINSLGRNTYSLDAVPDFLDLEHPRRLILDFLHDAIEGHNPRTLEDKRKRIAANIACKSKSVKGASYLLPEKMDFLVKSLFQTKQPFICPHGRPTCITLTKEDLEKQFGRR